MPTSTKFRITSESIPKLPASPRHVGPRLGKERVHTRRERGVEALPDWDLANQSLPDYLDDLAVTGLCCSAARSVASNDEAQILGDSDDQFSENRFFGTVWVRCLASCG